MALMRLEVVLRSDAMWLARSFLEGAYSRLSLLRVRRSNILKGTDPQFFRYGKRNPTDLTIVSFLCK